MDSCFDLVGSRQHGVAKFMLVSRKVNFFYVVKSAVQFVVCLFIYWLIRSFADLTYTLNSIIHVRGPLHSLLLFFIYFGTVGLYRSDMLFF